MVKDPKTRPATIEEAAAKLGATARAEMKRRGMTDAEVDAAIKGKGRKGNA